MTQSGLHFEDFAAGQERQLGSYTVTAEEIVAFARQYDPQPFHLSEEAGRASHFGSLVASGWMTCGIMMRLAVQGMLEGSASMGSPGVDQVRWLKPVRAGDTLRLTIYTREVRASVSKSDRGIVYNEWRAYNQRDELVCTIDGMGMFGRRHPGTSS